MIEDDGKVAYAYLYHKENVVGDVWLYNVMQAPAATEWRKEDMPFLNPQEFLIDNAWIEPLSSEDDIQCEWESLNGSMAYVKIKIRGELIAKMAPDVLLGWSKLVKKDGPLAKVWS